VLGPDNVTVVVCLKGEIKGRFHAAFFLKLGLLWWVLCCYAAQRMGESLTVKHSYRKLNSSISLWKWDNLLSQDFMPNVWAYYLSQICVFGQIGQNANNMTFCWCVILLGQLVVSELHGVILFQVELNCVCCGLDWWWLLNGLWYCLSCFWKTYESGAKMQNLMVYKLLMIS